MIELVSSEQMCLMIIAQEMLNEKYNGKEWRKVVSLGKAKFALYDEVSEFAREIEADWKWWKPEVKAVQKQKAIFELIDVVHFALLLGLYRTNVDNLVSLIDEHNLGPDMFGPHPDPHNQFSKAIQRFLQAVDLDAECSTAVGLFNIVETGGQLLDLKPGEIFAAYLAKNARNHERVDGGVLEGRYDKSMESELTL